MIEISSVRFFTGLERKEVRVILAAAKRRKLAGGEIIGLLTSPRLTCILYGVAA
jgi:hypothetical protein